MRKKHTNFLKNNILVRIWVYIALFFAMSNAVYSQYIKIPVDTNYYWRQGSVANASVSNCSYEYNIRYVKDTIISSKTYNKYSDFGAAFGNTVSPCNPYHVKDNFLRQDTVNKRVFILDNNFTERPLYNFTKVVGDTMQVYQNYLNANITVTVTIVDSIQFTDGVYHKYQRATIGSTYLNLFVQGLGAIRGGLYANQSIGFLNSADEFYCFGKVQPFSVLHTTNQKPCYLTNVGLKNISKLENFINIYPNPVIDKLNIEIETGDLQNRKLTILNSIGQVVYSTNILNQKEEINLSFLASGFYYLKVQNNSNQKVFKIIKE